MNRTRYTSDQIIKIGKRVKECRNFKNYSQKQLADLLKIKKDVIRRIEIGELKSIDVELIIRIANCLQCDSDYLLLKTHLFHSSDASTNYLSFPNMQKTVDGYLYTHRQLLGDLTYMINYMHEDYQNHIINNIHNLVLLHKVAVSFPNVTNDIASQLKPDTILSLIEKNFFDANQK